MLMERAGAGYVLLLVIAALACAVPAREAALQKADSRLRQLARSHPDSVISVLVRTTGPVTSPERAELERARLSVRSVLGDVVTGDVRARDVERLNSLTFVLALEHSRDIPVRQP
jgi:hypothetical protein